jgi:hypothetical protein
MAAICLTPPELGVEFLNVFLGDTSSNLLGIRLPLVGGSKQQIRQSIKPRLMSLASGASELDASARRHDDQALPVQTGWHGVVIGYNPHRLNLNTLSSQL